MFRPPPEKEKHEREKEAQVGVTPNTIHTFFLCNH